VSYYSPDRVGDYPTSALPSSETEHQPADSNNPNDVEIFQSTRGSLIDEVGSDRLGSSDTDFRPSGDSGAKPMTTVRNLFSTADGQKGEEGAKLGGVRANGLNNPLLNSSYYSPSEDPDERRSSETSSDRPPLRQAFSEV
jgi:hypothetical protein